VTFTAPESPGDYSYYCGYHMGTMHGVLRVRGPTTGGIPALVLGAVLLLLIVLVLVILLAAVRRRKKSEEADTAVPPEP